MKLWVLLKNKKGYAFPMVLMIVTIISILGVSILGLSMANLRFQIADTKEKQSFYLAEAGLDEAYVLIKQKIEKVIDLSKNDAQESVNRTITEELSQDPENESSQYYLTYRDGGINEQNVNSELTRIFKLQYKKYINDEMLDYVNNTENYKGITADTAVAFAQDNDSWNYLINDDSNNTYKLRASSQINNTKVTTILKIGVPSYSINYSDNTVPVDVKENILWLRPITSEGRIISSGNGGVEINGDVYAYGGAEVASNTTINGSFYSWGDIAKKASSSKTVFTVSNGNVYCNSLKLDSGITSGGENKVSIEGNVFTRDDIELNSEKSNVSINGSYYGFSDGTSIAEDNSIVTGDTEYGPDFSSSILVNASDIGETNGSSLTISGNDDDIFQDNADNPLKMENMGLESGVVIAGTAYVNAENPDTREKYYQTGESISIKGNYRAYLQPLWIKDSIGGIDYRTYNASNINFNPFGSMRLADEFKKFVSDNNEEIKNYKMLPFQRSNYFQLVDKLVDNKINTIKKIGINIEADKIQHTAGSWIGIQDSIPVIGTRSGGIDLYREVPNDYLFYTNKLGDPIYEYNTKGETGYDFRRERKDLNIRDYIENRYNFSAYTVPSTLSQANELIYISNSDNSYNIGKTNETNSYKGIVITKGDIHIKGNVNFTGILVTKGNIYFDDDGGVKNIYYNKRYLLKKIAENSSLRNSFIYYNNEKVDNVIINPDIDVRYDDQTNAAIDNLITISDWNKARAAK